MTAESVAYTTLRDDGAVSGLVGTRIYPDFVPQEQALPAIAVSRVSTEFVTTIHTEAPVAEITSLDVWCMAETRVESESVADAALSALTAAHFAAVDRRPEFDAESNVYAAVLTMQILVNY